MISVPNVVLSFDLVPISTWALGSHVCCRDSVIKYLVAMQHESTYYGFRVSPTPNVYAAVEFIKITLAWE